MHKVGPGSYNYQVRSLHSPSYTFSLKHRQEKSELSPGPGEYAIINSSNKRDCSVKFGKNKRLVSKDNLSPGPGAYNVVGGQTQPKKGPRFTKSTRAGMDRSVNNPGPGEYNLNESFRALFPNIQRTFGGQAKDKVKKAEKSPGRKLKNTQLETMTFQDGLIKALNKRRDSQCQSVRLVCTMINWSEPL